MIYLQKIARIIACERTDFKQSTAHSFRFRSFELLRSFRYFPTMLSEPSEKNS